MALNVFRSAQVVDFHVQQACFYGWYISTSGDSQSLEVFATKADRDRFVQIVQDAHKEASNSDAEWYAAMAAFYHHGDRELVLSEILEHPLHSSELLEELSEFELGSTEKDSNPDVLLPSRLTAENGAKALLSGEFYEEIKVHNTDFDPDCNEETSDEPAFVTEKVYVKWDTIKKIYAAAVAHFMKGQAGEQSNAGEVQETEDARIAARNTHGSDGEEGRAQE